MKKAYLFAGLAILFWSTVATTCKFLLGDLNSMQLLWMNALIAGVFLLIANICNGNLKKLQGYTVKDYLLMAAIGTPGTFFYYVFYYAGTDLMPASQAFIINYLWPIMSVVFACIILKERLTVKKVFAILVSFIGVTVVIGDALKALDQKTLMGAGFCVLGAVSYGVFTALSQKMQYDKMMTQMVSYFVTFCVTTAINLCSNALFLPRIDQMAGFLWNGIFTVALANIIWVMALEKGGTAKISNLAYITPFLSSLWTWVFLNDPLTANSFIGLAIIMLGILIQLLDKKKPETVAQKANI